MWADDSRRTFGAVFLAFWMFPSIAFAQLSPGPLSAAHEELEGVKNCLKCHGVKETRVDPHCLDCHGEIARLRADGRGFHARDAAGACADCHLEHGGREFELIHWDEGSAKDFDHSRTGWNLTGKHAEAECEACHTAAFQKSPTFDLRPAGSGERSWLGLETGCVNCHVDPHEDRFGQDCAQCHLTSKWQDLVEASFDHDRTRYPLRGAHVKVQCSDCHKNGFAELPRFDECRSCHEDPHDGKATLAGAKVDCASCHLVDHFAPATWDVARHANTKMPLEGKHREVSCKGCHGEGKKFDFRPKFAACADCHEDAHAGQLAKIDKGRCDSCHDVKGFLPSSFTVARHQDSWKLEGAHADAKCRACHGPERTNLPPLPGIAVTGKAGALFRMGDVACITCHADPHRGELGTSYASLVAEEVFEALWQHDRRSEAREVARLAARRDWITPHMFETLNRVDHGTPGRRAESFRVRVRAELDTVPEDWPDGVDGYTTDLTVIASDEDEARQLTLHYLEQLEPSVEVVFDVAVIRRGETCEGARARGVARIDGTRAYFRNTEGSRKAAR